MRISCYELARQDLITGIYNPLNLKDLLPLRESPWIVIKVVGTQGSLSNCVSFDVLLSDGQIHNYMHTVERFYEVER